MNQTILSELMHLNERYAEMVNRYKTPGNDTPELSQAISWYEAVIGYAKGIKPGKEIEHENRGSC
jgi:hypothetical protein